MHATLQVIMRSQLNALVMNCDVPGTTITSDRIMLYNIIQVLLSADEPFEIKLCFVFENEISFCHKILRLQGFVYVFTNIVNLFP